MKASELKVFLCYAREDVEMAEKLFKDLTYHGVNVWFDKKSLYPGSNS